jgi:hypothetical protein
VYTRLAPLVALVNDSETDVTNGDEEDVPATGVAT